MARAARFGVVLSWVVLLAATAAPPVQAHGDQSAVTIRYTEGGIPHIVARDHVGLGYGYGYASAQDGLCTLAEAYLTVGAERSRHLGPDAPGNPGLGSASTSLVSDLYFQRVNDSGAVDRYARSASPAVRDLVRGYVNGYNRFLASHPVRDPACAGRGWVRPIAERDVYRHAYAITLVSGSGAMMDGLVSAQPPTTPVPATVSADALATAAATEDEGLGSNAIAIGAQDATRGGAVLLANPHYPWQGVRRFWQSHLTIPGELDVSGASLLGFPVVAIGHNADVAWSHTVSTATTVGLFEVPTVPGSPTRYLVDGVPQDMERQDVSVQVRAADGTIGVVTRTLWSTRYGPVLAGIPGVPLPWGSTAYVLRDANAGNFRLLETWVGLDRARSVGEVRSTLATTQGLPWVNTLAVDRGGSALYADIQVVPGVTDEHAAACNTPTGAMVFPRTGLSILDGSRSACDWVTDPDARGPGLLGPARMPSLIRRDHVANANNTPWLANPDAPLSYPRVFGEAASEPSMRAQQAQLSVQRRIDGVDGLPGRGFSNETMRQLLFTDASRVAELAAADTARMCASLPGGAAPSSAGPVDVSAVCPVLAAWDGSYRLDSRGALLFARFVLRAKALPTSPWLVPFDPANPLTTPNTLAVDRPDVRVAFGDAVRDLAAAGVAPDAPLADGQSVTRAGREIPIHGGPHDLGVLDVITPVWTSPGGNTEVVHGSSFIQVVEFRRGAPPEAHSLLTYSQSADPTSPHHADQTVLFSQGKWVRERFTERDIRSSPVLRTVVLSGTR